MLTPARAGEALVARDEPIPWASRIRAEVMLLVGLTLLGAVLRFATVSHQRGDVLSFLDRRYAWQPLLSATQTIGAAGGVRGLRQRRDSTGLNSYIVSL